MNPSSTPALLAADYFDGTTARPHAVTLSIRDGRLHIEGGPAPRAVPIDGLRWPERTRHGVRMLHLPGGGSLHCQDGPAWDAWSAAAAGRRDGWVVRVQQRWRWVAASLLVLVLLFSAGYRWGLPWVATVLVAALPASADEAIGEAALASADARGLLQPSALPAARRRAIEASFAEAVSHLPAGTVPRYHLEFRQGAMGPNAFALPGGALVVTDQLVELVHGERGVIAGVLGHELGHLRHRHGMRMLVQATAVGAAIGALYGDFSNLLAVVPTWLAQASYSRDFERQADAESVRLLRADGLSPGVMAQFFVTMQEARDRRKGESAPQLGIAFASHPADAERIAFFEQAARGR